MLVVNALIPIDISNIINIHIIIFIKFVSSTKVESAFIQIMLSSEQFNDFSCYMTQCYLYWLRLMYVVINILALLC